MDKTQIFVLLVVLTLSNAACIYGATTHKHEQQSRERLKDGVFIPRDANHERDGEHNVEFDHEAIIGNVKEAQEFDTLTPEESKRRLAILAKMMDLNRDGYVEKHELRVWILRSFEKLSKDEANDRFEEVDADSDEQVTWREYMLDAYGMEDETFKKELIEFDSYEEEQKMIRDDKEMFLWADIASDGFLTREEFYAFATPEDHPRMVQVLLKQTMRDRDTNQDGHIDFTEFIGGSAIDQDKEWLVAEKDRFDRDYDKDGDGVLTQSEVLSWIIPSNYEIATDEVNHLMSAADADFDQRLSMEEILDNYDTFVGSEATDYGDHLHNFVHAIDEL